jgi:hypothetical protein
VAYAGGWKKLEPMWDWVIRTRRVAKLRPMLEAVLTGFGRYGTRELPGTCGGSSPAATPATSACGSSSPRHSRACYAPWPTEPSDSRLGTRSVATDSRPPRES